MEQVVKAGVFLAVAAVMTVPSALLTLNFVLANVEETTAWPWLLAMVGWNWLTLTVAYLVRGEKMP